MRKGRYEYRRTCSRCGNTRFLPADVVEAEPVKHAKMVGWLTPVVGKKRQLIRAEKAMIEAQNVNLADVNRCPECGSSAWEQERVSIA